MRDQLESQLDKDAVAPPARISCPAHAKERRKTHSANLCSPGHHDGVGDRGGQAHE